MHNRDHLNGFKTGFIYLLAFAEIWISRSMYRYIQDLCQYMLQETHKTPVSVTYIDTYSHLYRFMFLIFAENPIFQHVLVHMMICIGLKELELLETLF
jgi:hypothetical protein